LHILKREKKSAFFPYGKRKRRHLKREEKKSEIFFIEKRIKNCPQSLMGKGKEPD
jgi:hypothetical protein